MKSVVSCGALVVLSCCLAAAHSAAMVAARGLRNEGGQRGVGAALNVTGLTTVEKRGLLQMFESPLITMFMRPLMSMGVEGIVTGKNSWYIQRVCLTGGSHEIAHSSIKKLIFNYHWYLRSVRSFVYLEPSDYFFLTGALLSAFDFLCENEEVLNAPKPLIPNHGDLGKDGLLISPLQNIIVSHHTKLVGSAYELNNMCTALGDFDSTRAFVVEFVNGLYDVFHAAYLVVGVPGKITASLAARLVISLMDNLCSSPKVIQGVAEPSVQAARKEYILSVLQNQ